VLFAGKSDQTVVMFLKSNFVSNFFVLLLTYGFVNSCSKDPEPRVEKNEGLFINELSAASGEDWIELYNSEEKDLDLTGYRIYDDQTKKYELPMGTTIPAKGFLVLICDDASNGLHTNFKLSSTGESVYLENAAGKIIDLVKFTILNDGESFGRFPDGSTNLGTSGISTRGTANGDRAPLIESVKRSIAVPKPDEAVTISAEVLSNTGISKVKLFYRLSSGEFSEVAMEKKSSAYEATIPAFNTTGEVQYYVTAENSHGTITMSPSTAPEKTYHYLLNTDELPDLRINEFLAANVACCPDTDGGTEEFDDWVEIYNAGSTPVNIAGMYLSDDRSDPFKNHVDDANDERTTIQPGGFIILWADEQGTQGELHMNFKLSADGEDIGLYYIDGRAIDEYTFGKQQENVSQGLSVDGGNVWKSFTDPTPGKSNNQ
jgi:hypothetical protein